MKNRVSRLLSIGIALAAVVAVQAQDNIMTADVPFSFHVGSDLMPKGAYRINEFAQGAMVWIGSVRSNATKGVTTMNLVGNKETEPGRLVFHRYGQEYFLAEIWNGDTSSGRALARSQREKELAQSATPSLTVIRLSLPH